MQYWIWLSRCKGMSVSSKLALYERLGSAQAVYESGMLAQTGLEEAAEILQNCKALGIGLLTAGDKRYPRRLLAIADPPLVLYYRGTLPDFDREAAIGVVGTRKASAYGLMIAESMGRQISQHGGLVVSGMAAGIDAQAGWGAVRCGAPTVGVLGGGIDVVYPASNRALYEAVEACGCLISEYPPGTLPGKWTFPQRNRIISGLSLGVLAVEAPEKSGTMITVRDAQKQGRDLFAVPGQVGYASCEGTNSLLAEGAHAATCGWDILRHYEAQFPEKLRKNAQTAKEQFVSPIPSVKRPVEQKIAGAAKGKPSPASKSAPLGDTAEEQAVLSALSEGERNYDEIITATNLPAGKVLAVLTMLEIKGMVKTLPGRRVIRNL